MLLTPVVTQRRHGEAHVGFVVVEAVHVAERHSLRTAVTDRSRALAESEARFRALAESTSDLVCLHTPDGVYQYASPSVRRLLGYEPDELVGTHPIDYIHPDQRAHVERRFHIHTAAGSKPVEFSYRIRRRGGAYTWFETVITPIVSNGQVVQLQSSSRDITERKRTEEELVRLAFHDELTGLPNRALALDRIGQALAVSRRTNQPWACLFIDLDGFKVVNDTIGHYAGDATLVAVAERLTGLVRPGDTLARLGGDEFVMLCPGADGAARRRSSPAACCTRSGNRSPSTDAPSISPPASASPSRKAPTTRCAWSRTPTPRCTTRNAPAAIASPSSIPTNARRSSIASPPSSHCDAPSSATNCCCTTNPRSISPRVASSASRRSCAGNATTASSCRPATSSRSPKRPGSSSSSGAGSSKKRAARSLAWEAQGAGPDLRVWVNVSARQLGQPDLVPTVQAAIRAARIRPQSLCLEITESALMEDAEAAAAQLDQLRSLGISLGVDDFGTGYSSLAYLNRFPLDVLKIDRSFVARLDADTEAETIVAAIIDLAHALDLVVIAEGVETEAQLAVLRRLECDQAVGLLLQQATAGRSADRRQLYGAPVRHRSARACIRPRRPRPADRRVRRRPRCR